MSSLSRRQFFGAVGAASATIAGALPKASSAGQAEFTLKYANNLAPVHPMNVRAKEAADAIRRDTNGRVDLQIFPNGQMGSDTDMLSQVRSGAIDFFTLSGMVLANLVPVASVPGVGFAFKDYDHVWAAVDGDLGKHVREQIGKAGLVAMDKIWDNGFRQITTSTKPINTPADLHNFKIRVPVGPMWVSVFKTLGAAPTTINFNEVYSALQTKVVEGEENPLALIETSRFYEVQKFCSLTSHMWDGFWFLANGKSWNRLPKDLQQVLAHHINAAGVAERADVAALNKNLETGLKAKGLSFNSPQIDPFRAVLQKGGFYAEWRKKYGDEAWGLLEKYTGKLA